MFTPEEIAEYLREYNKNKEFWDKMWEPRFGDWVRTKHGVGIITELVLSATLIVREQPVYRVDYVGGDQNYPFKSDMMPLFTEGQLLRFLEKRGYTWSLDALWNDYQASIFEEGDLTSTHIGPTPIIALMRCVMRVMNDE